MSDQTPADPTICTSPISLSPPIFPSHRRRSSLPTAASIASSSSLDDLPHSPIYPTPLTAMGISTIFPGLVGGGPFPRFEGSSHSVDPHGLNRFLLHPGDGLWDYLRMEPLVREGGVEGNGNVVGHTGRHVQDGGEVASGTHVGERQAQTTKLTPSAPSGRSSKMAMSRTKSPLGLPPMSPEQTDDFNPVDRLMDPSEPSVNTQVGNTISSSSATVPASSKFGKATLKLRKSASSFSVLKARSGKTSAPPSSSMTVPSVIVPPRSRTTSYSPAATKSTLSLLSSTGTNTDESINLATTTIGRRTRQSSLDLVSASRSPSAHSLAGSLASTISSEEREGVVTPMESENGHEGEISIESTGVVDGEGLQNRWGPQGFPNVVQQAQIIQEKRKVEVIPSRSENNKTPTPPMSGSGWKSWFGGKRNKAVKPVIVTRGLANTGAKAINRLSADVLAGVLPGSVAPTESAATVKELDLQTSSAKPVPESVQNLRSTSISKLSALRAPSPHPIVNATQMPGYLSLDGMRSGSTSAAAALKFPRSQNAYMLPGMGLGPAEAGMRIDVVVRGLIKRIDGGSFDVSEVEHCATQLSMEERMETRYRHKRQRQRSAEAKGSGVLLFTKRPTFEGRCDEYGPGGDAHTVQTAKNRALYDIEYSLGLQALADEIRDGRLSAMPTVRPRPQTLPAYARSRSRQGSTPPSEKEDEDTDEYGSADDFAVTPTQATSTSQIPAMSLPRPSSTSSVPDASTPSTLQPTLSPRRPSMPDMNTSGNSRQVRQSQIPLRPISKVTAWVSDSEDSESEADSDSGDEGLMYKARPSSNTSTASTPVPAIPVRNALRNLDQQGPPPTRTSEDYRMEIARTRERRENSRSGQVERQSVTENLAKAHAAAAQRASGSKDTSMRPISAARSQTMLASAGQPRIAHENQSRMSSGSTARPGHQQRRSMSQVERSSNAYMLPSTMSMSSIPSGYPQGQMMYVPVMVPYQQYPMMASPMQQFPASYSMPGMSPQAMMEHRPRPNSMSFGAGGRAGTYSRTGGGGGAGTGRRSPVQ